MSPMRQSALLRLRRCQSEILARSKGLRNDAGAALVELAVMLAILGMPLLLATVYFAVLLIDNLEVSNAAHAGAMYGMRSSTFADDNSGMIAASKAESSRFGSNLIVTPSNYYTCSNALGGTQYADQASASAACNGGSSHTLQCVKVLVSASVTPPGQFPGFAKTVTLKGVSIMVVEE